MLLSKEAKASYILLSILNDSDGDIDVDELIERAAQAGAASDLTHNDIARAYDQDSLHDVIVAEMDARESDSEA